VSPRCIGATLAAALVACCAVPALAPASASAFATNPAWTVSAVATPTNFAPGDEEGEDSFTVTVTNTGDAPTNGSTVTIGDMLPEGVALAPAGTSATELLSGFHWPLGEGEEGPLKCTGLMCTFAGVVASGDSFTVNLPVLVKSTEAGSLGTSLVTVSGGGAAEASVSTPVTASSTPSPGFGVASGAFSTTLSNVQAGAHADMTTSFFFNESAPLASGGDPEGRLKDTVVDLPAGFAGDPAAVSTCTEAQLNERPGEGVTAAYSACPVDSQVGTIALTLALSIKEGEGIKFKIFPAEEIAPVYNMQPLGGEVARLGFKTARITSNVIVKVRPGNYGLEAVAPNLVSGDVEVEGVRLTVWGVPALHSHDLLRGTACEKIGEFNRGCDRAVPVSGTSNFEEVPVGSGAASTAPAMPFLSNPTRCTESPLVSSFRVDTWQDRGLPPESEPSAISNLGPMAGCERLEFDPSLGAQPTSIAAETPTGLDVTQTLPQTYSNPVALATAHLNKVVVTLPEGMTVNPSAGEGLGACTEKAFDAEALEAPANRGEAEAREEACPNDSSLGTVRIHTPVLNEEAEGSLFLAQPYQNRFGSLLAVYVVARIPNRGVIVKLEGKVTPNEETGQLVTTFEDLPQLPFDKATFSFRPGEAAPLVTPPVCGSFSALGEFASWAEPEQILAGFSAPFEITQGVGGGACPSGGVPPLHPQLLAGTYSAAAGSYSPFFLHITRQDGEQEITGFSSTLPSGLTGNLTGVPFCGEAEIQAAREATGRDELERPSCPAASQIGHTLVSAGVGGVTAQTPGSLYLAGPYRGAPFSIVSVTSATVGPFDLGTVVIRFPLRINPTTAQVEVQTSPTEPIPHIIKGIVVHVRDIRAYIDRPNFTIDPTNCDPMSIAAQVAGAGADPSNPADQDSVGVSALYQAVNCANLAFHPGFKVSTSGHTSRAEGASLTATLTYPQAPLGTQANIAQVKVQLPKKLPSRLSTLQKACPAATFDANPASCPAASRVGVATATTPIIPEPLTGPAYFVSHGGEAFPDLIIVLQGYGVTVDLVGSTFINEKTSITTSTFKTVPDVPVGTFQLTLGQGPYSALAAHGDLCKSKLTMPTEFIAQDGATITQSTPIAVTGCPKHKAKKAKKAKKASHRSHHKRGKR
jgi:uncharacterized repeat protein (TIGR01451 family)